MPLYCFECDSCANKFEVIQKTFEPNPLCDKCNGKTKKVLSSFSFQLKGHAWARDGYSYPKKPK